MNSLNLPDILFFKQVYVGVNEHLAVILLYSFSGTSGLSWKGRCIKLFESFKVILME